MFTETGPGTLRRLDLFDAFSLVVGTIIGTGIFLKAGIMSQTVGSPQLVLWAWVAAGLLSLTGALTYAELGAMFPRAGGEYVYLREAYGKLPAFLYGWQRFWIGGPGSIAAYSVGAATFASPLIDLAPLGGIQGTSLFLISVFTLINMMSVKLGGRLSSFMTTLKVSIILFICVGIFTRSQGGSFENFSSVPDSGFVPSAFGAAMLAALWAYDGWNNLPMVAGEVKNPARNIPFALGFGVLAILAIYLTVNFAYFFALPFPEVLTAFSKTNASAPPIATKAAITFLGDSGYWILGFAFFFSAIGAMHASVLTNARVPYAMAKDGLFIPALSYHHPKTEVPLVSLTVQWLMASILAWLGTFDQLTEYVVFASWIFYALCAYAVILLRKRHPKIERPYRAMGYPWLPTGFIAASLLLLANTLYTNPDESFSGLLIIAVGVPFYFLKKKFSAKAL